MLIGTATVSLPSSQDTVTSDIILSRAESYDITAFLSKIELIFSFGRQFPVLKGQVRIGSSLKHHAPVFPIKTSQSDSFWPLSHSESPSAYLVARILFSLLFKFRTETIETVIADNRKRLKILKTTRTSIRVKPKLLVIFINWLTTVYSCTYYYNSCFIYIYIYTIFTIETIIFH